MKQSKKTVAWLMMVLLMVAAVAYGAVADESSYSFPTNPYRAEDLKLEQIDRQMRLTPERRALKASEAGFHMEQITAPTYDQDGVYEIVNDSGTTSEKKFFVQVYIDSLGEDRLIYSMRNIEGTRVTVPALVLPADYRISLFCKDKNASDSVPWDWCSSFTFFLASDADHPTLDEIVTDIVNECRVAGDDWNTALKLHDWLTHHAYYDNTYTNYGPDGVLVKGTGVCDSYSKAYLFLLRKAGIDAERIISDSMNHAWNLVCFDGTWTHVDVTWDDPVNQDNPNYM